MSPAPISSQKAQHPVRRVITNRRGGVSAAPYASFNLAHHVGDDPAAVTANRVRLAASLELEPQQIIWMEQLHTNNVSIVNAEYVAQNPDTPVAQTDALITTTPGLALGVLVADCVPVLLADETAGVIAAVHAGRMGARNGIVRKTVNKMVELGACPADISVLLGPAAGGESYEVPQAMAADVEKHLPGSMVKTSTGKTGLDLRQGILAQLLSLGVSSFAADPRDTISDKDFFSYRREGKTGRQAGIIWMNS
ncbi:peptidoglycan editing factor PgeF [Corynebacterium caspium]|uniref:peptidoglycan editing factor PgeF n=1 Tax=Corynebacterium caspium TaxID=234828 RepID=UPI00036E3F0C|nr:peptidoglycan editing factor PgeF [Corynebacterium caspium]WKD59000.1 Laccase domain protein YfiH [Corynebacterium caspium DSM 44850]